MQHAGILTSTRFVEHTYEKRNHQEYLRRHSGMHKQSRSVSLASSDSGLEETPEVREKGYVKEAAQHGTKPNLDDPEDSQCTTSARLDGG